MVTIQLNNLEFYAFHGLHEEEAILGATFEVSATVSFEPSVRITSIDQTINYANVYTIIKNQMLVPVKLLETLAENIIDEIAASDNRIKNIWVSINKIHPPLTNFIGKLGVTFQKAY